MMKNSCILKQALCLLSLLIITCDSKRPMKKKCPTERIMKESINLLNKTSEFRKLFPDNLTSIKLLTTALKKEFAENCSTRNHLLSFYTNDVLSADLISPEAEKRGIKDAFLGIEDMLKSCPFNDCHSTKSSEETVAMKELRAKITKITLKEKLHKAINEIDMFLDLIRAFAIKIRSPKSSSVLIS